MATAYKDKKEKKQKEFTVETHVISETKIGDRVFKRMVVEKTEVSKGNFITQTFHELANRSGGFNRSRGAQPVKKSSTPIIHSLKEGYRTW